MSVIVTIIFSSVPSHICCVGCSFLVVVVVVIVGVVVVVVVIVRVVMVIKVVLVALLFSLVYSRSLRQE